MLDAYLRKRGAHGLLLDNVYEGLRRIEEEDADLEDLVDGVKGEGEGIVEQGDGNELHHVEEESEHLAPPKLKHVLSNISEEGSFRRSMAMSLSERT